MTTTKPRLNTTYRAIPESEVPAGLTWDTPGVNQGQIVEVSYGDFGRGAPDEGSLYRCIEDRSGGAKKFAIRVGPMWIE